MKTRYTSTRSALGLIVAVALAVGPGLAAATADGPDFFQVTGVAANDTLNLREAPDPGAEKVGEIPPDGTCIRNLGCQGGLTFQEFTELSKSDQEKRLKENPRWCRVEYRGMSGWVAGRYLREGACSE